MKVMGSLWPLRPAVAVLSRFLVSFFVLVGLSSIAHAQLEDGELVLKSGKTARLALLLEDTKLAVEQQAISVEDLDALPPLTVTMEGPGRRRIVAPSQTIAFEDTGLTSSVTYVIDPTMPSAAAQVASVPLLLEATGSNQTFVLVINTPTGWLIAGELKQGDTLADLNLSPSVERPRYAPLDYAARDIADRQLIVFSHGELALEDLGELSADRNEAYFAISAGYPEPLPDGIYGLGALDAAEDAQRIMQLANSGSVNVFDFSEFRRMPFEGNGDFLVQSRDLTHSFDLAMPTYGFGYLINPLNIPNWLGTPGRRLFGLITTVLWTSLILIAWFIAKAPRREESTSPIAEIELFYEGRSVSVDRLPFSIGRAADNDLIIEDDATSRHHAELRRNGEGELIFVDLGSANGSLIEGERLKGPMPVNGGLDLSLPSARIFIRPPA
ncbi:MAG: FHA domain-containing protein [Pseudomonadota bacterium]